MCISMVMNYGVLFVNYMHVRIAIRATEEKYFRRLQLNNHVIK